MELSRVALRVAIFQVFLFSIFSKAEVHLTVPSGLEGQYAVKMDCSGCKAPYLSKYLDAELDMILYQDEADGALVSFNHKEFGNVIFQLRVVRTTTDGYLELSSLGVDPRPMEGRLRIHPSTGSVDGVIATAANEMSIRGERSKSLQYLYASKPVSELTPFEVEGHYVGTAGGSSAELFVRRMTLFEETRFVASAWIGDMVAIHFQNGVFDAERGLISFSNERYKWTLGYRLNSENQPSWTGLSLTPVNGGCRELILKKR